MKYNAEKPVIISAATALFLLVLKIVAGIFTGSIVILSEALDSLTDLLSMIGSYVGIRVSKKKPSKEFNYGFGKAENITSLFVSLIIISAAFALGKMAYDSFFSYTHIHNSIFAYAIESVSIIASAMLSFYLYKKSKKLDNDLLLISSRERLADVFRGIIVVTSIYLHELEMHYIQGIVTIIICFAVFYIGIKSLAFSVKGLMDAAPNNGLKGKIEIILRKNGKIKSFKNLRMKKSGPYIFGDVEIQVNKRYSLKEAHQIADEIEKEIKKEFENIASFLIHVEPYE